MNGKGRKYYVNGDWMYGEFRDDLIHGKAMLGFLSGEVEEAMYENGERVDKK